MDLGVDTHARRHDCFSIEFSIVMWTVAGSPRTRGVYETRIKDQLTTTSLTLTNTYSSYDVITGILNRKQVLIALLLKEKVLR